MLQISLYTLGSVLLVSAISLVGVLFFLRDRFMRKMLLTFVSFSSGALLGDVFIHLLPEIAEGTLPLSRGYFIVLGGIVFSFVVEKIIHWRHCHLLPEDEREHDHCHNVGAMSLVGDSVHNFIDGLAIAASFLVSVPVGISTTVAVMFHEIPDEIGNFAILLHSGYSRSRALFYNFLSALTAVLGAVVVLVSAGSLESLNVYLLPFAAGNLLYIAGSDLIPELHKEEALPKSILQLLSMVAGIGVMYAMLFLE
ncbi:MAG: ZIP family metal transporter [Candidatus Peribacteraceae bacterium]|nr:ZIP family metal transporter [Candidatus Peribacteraceae bacterium]